MKNPFNVFPSLVSLDAEKIYATVELYVFFFETTDAENVLQHPFPWRIGAGKKLR